MRANPRPRDTRRPRDIPTDFSPIRQSRGAGIIQTATAAIDARDPGTRPSTEISAVRLEGLGKRFGDVVAVDRVDLDVRDGEFFSMLGPSGRARRRPCA